jgi:tRNA nucleotidyltransferase/poly(A) polymerase
MKIELPQDVLFISRLYKKAGKDLFVVGGAVRDALRGIEPKDFDLATNASPDESIRILSKHFNVKEVGKAFGVIVAITKQFPDGIEVATFRKDLGTGRRPESVEFTTIETDVLRRDLTINALFYNIDTQEIVDLVGGKLDLEARIIRTVGNPGDRFSDDPLRRLRAVRFMADLDGTLEDSLDESLRTCSDITSVSPERIRDEFLKLLKGAKDLRRSIDTLRYLRFMHQIFPNLSVLIDKLAIDPIVTVALMLRDNVDEVTEETPYPFKRLQHTLNALRWTIDEIATICYLIRLTDLGPSRVYFLKKQEKRCSVTPEQIRQFALAIGKDPVLIETYLQYEITTDATALVSMGFEYNALGAEMERIETKLFLDLLKTNLDG